MWPAWELVRRRYSKVPRGWARIWTDEGGTIYSGNRMAALITDDIWYRINKFGFNYPPFDFGSGMGVELVPRDEAIEMGLIKEDELLQPDFDTPTLNSNLETQLEADEETWDEVLEHFKGFGEREGGRLVFTDPNGNKPYHPEQLANLIGRELPEGYDNLQRDSLVTWTSDYERIINNPDSDVSEHFRRLVSRTIPERKTDLWRGMSFEQNDFNSFLKGISKSGELKLDRAFTSFSNSPSASVRYAEGKSVGLLINIRDSVTGRDISPSVHKFYPKNKDEDEVIFNYGATFKVLEDGEAIINGRHYRRIIVREKRKGEK